MEIQWRSTCFRVRILVDSFRAPALSVAVGAPIEQRSADPPLLRAERIDGGNLPPWEDIVPMRQETYADVRDRVRAGDVIAFGGRGLLSHIVKVAGGSNVSHAGAIVAEAGPGREPQFVESTVDVWADPPVYRVAISSFEDRCRTYDGEVWWLPLGDAVRRALDVQAFVDFMRNAGGQRFDIVGGMTVTLIELFRRVTGTEQQRQLESYFCSELVAKALRDAGAVKNLDSPWVSPTDLCRWSIYEGDYSHLRPDAENQNEIVGYNSRPPGST